ncbi:hypothetical protein [Streptomyces sp. NPDC002722]|uniref:terpene synthase family protein n=1 Tax=Streptomyces sp. NPDC002722 TaxID=3154425 RepID=UPI0033219FDB
MTEEPRALPYRIPPLYCTEVPGHHPETDRIKQRPSELLAADRVLDKPEYRATYENQDVAEMVACCVPTAGVDALVAVGPVSAINGLTDNPQTGDTDRPSLHHGLTGGDPTIGPEAVTARVADPATEDLVAAPLPKAFLRALRRLPADKGNDKRRLTVESVLTWLGAEARVERLQAGNCELGLEEAIAIRLETMGGFLAASLILPLFPAVTAEQAKHPEVLRVVSLLVVALAAHNELHSGYNDLASGSKCNWVQAFAREADATLQGRRRPGRRPRGPGVLRGTAIYGRSCGTYDQNRLRRLPRSAGRPHRQLSLLVVPAADDGSLQVPCLDLSRACPVLTSRPRVVGAPDIACLDHLWIQA